LHTVLLDKEVPKVHGRDWQRVPEQIKSGQYSGTASTTRSGYKCMSWEKQASENSVLWWQAYTDRWWLTENTKEAKNYCRDPAWENFIWCHYKTSSNITSREECSVTRKF
jgi:hypothetical protein